MAGCLRPIQLSHGIVGCGRCMPCRIVNREKKTARLVLESLAHPVNICVTLTYNNENVPRDSDGVQILYPPDLQKFCKALKNRERTTEEKFRFFAVGEYGDLSGRPHYHLIAFTNGRQPLNIYQDLWARGGVYVDFFSDKAARYVAGYTTKKMLKPDSRGLNGRPPEFTRSSRHPAIGVPAVPKIAQSFHTEAGSEVLSQYGDILNAIRVGGKIYPLDYFIAQKLREEVGVPTRQSDRDRIHPVDLPEQEYPDAAELKKRWSSYIRSEALGKKRRRDNPQAFI